MRYLYLLMCFFIQASLMAQVPSWAARIKSISEDYVSDLATDAEGNVYAVGRFLDGVDFDPGPGIYNLNNFTQEKGNLFCVKYSSEGNLIWAKQIGGDRGVSVHPVNAEYLHPKIALDGNGYLYITGLFDYRMDLDPSSSGSFFLPLLSSTSATTRFLGKYTTDGDFVWAKRVGDENILGSVFNNMKVDTAGNIYLAGHFWNTVDFDPGPGTFNLTSDNKYDIVFMKITTNGDFAWARKIGNPGVDDIVKKIAIDGQSLYITGSYRGLVDFDPQSGVYNLQSESNSEDAYIAKYNLSDGGLQWAKTLGSGNGYDVGYAIQVDNSGNVYTSGHYRGTVDFDFSPNSTYPMTALGTGYSMYLLKLNTLGEFIWVKQFDAMGQLFPSETRPYDIAVKGDRVYFTGYFLTSMDCNPAANQQFIINSNGGNYDIYLISLDTNGSFLWAKSYGGVLHDYPYAVRIDKNDDIILGGKYSDKVNFFPTITNENVDGYDGFTIKLNKNGFLKTDDIATAEKIRIYPNPTSDKIFINSESEILDVKVFDIDGRLLLTKNVTGNSTDLDMTNLKVGMYTITVTGSLKSFSKKIIKK
ncbi:T9SS type A sorting domain-containing protein [Chryseobacterium sp. OV279]|uniref:T9SS type A sorting domain-containing protein n=1 Tax=Chryseobacterium sp. OV279 TaxID=1500285 RepID=UPI000921960E|nr:T9SS type A sorting domain-containing protein [Chryseobacterium sp. OV279]SHF81520.1 Por secretion system C-terminal sorting domain-containing protein [Chryseobacterium sp. OV279]